MKKINFLLWDSSNKSGSSLYNLGKKTASLIEKQINDSDGIGGCLIKIHYEDIPHIEAGTDENAMAYYKQLLKKNNFLFATSPGTFASIGRTKIKNIQESSSKRRILFNTTAVTADAPFKDLNLFDLRSNALSDTSVSILKRMEILRSLVKKNKIYHIANMTPKSKMFANMEQLNQHDIYLHSTYKKYTNDKNSLRKDIESFLSQSTQDDLINLGALQNSIKPEIFDILKNYNKNRFITCTPNNELDFRDINNTILLKDDANYDIYLSMEAFLEKIESHEYSAIEKSTFNNQFSQFEAPLLLKYASDINNLKYENDEDFISVLCECINKIDGKKDIYMGLSKDLAFKDNLNIIKTSALVKLASPINKSSSSPIKTLYKNQLSVIDGTQKISDVISFNIDIQRITNISIEEGTYGAELYLDVIGPYIDPISSIKFNNLSSINPKYESKEIESIEGNGIHSSRYLITANFDFKAIGSNYPFDTQFIYISLSAINNSLILQPVPEQYLDKEFDIDGWYLKDAKCGINRKKSWVALSQNLAPVPKINEEIRLGWELQRVNSMTLFKIGIPMMFLYTLVNYTVYLPSSESGTALGYLTTAFLSSIALYFSTERPQPLSMSTIDVIFAFFYIISGISLLMIIFAEFNPGLYEFFIYPLRIFLPISIISLGIFIKSRIASSKFKPSITQ